MVVGLFAGATFSQERLIPLAVASAAVIRRRKIHEMTKELLVLAASVIFAAGVMAFAGSWHPKTYTVVHAYATATSSKAGILTGSSTAYVPRDSGRKRWR